MFNKNPNWYYTQGQSTIYPPEIISLFWNKNFLKESENGTMGDDTYYTKILKRHNIKILHLFRGHNFCFTFHDEIKPISTARNNEDYKSCYQ